VVTIALFVFIPEILSLMSFYPLFSDLPDLPELQSQSRTSPKSSTRSNHISLSSPIPSGENPIDDPVNNDSWMSLLSDDIRPDLINPLELYKEIYDPEISQKHLPIMYISYLL
jgi:hypothetical protein